MLFSQELQHGVALVCISLSLLMKLIQQIDKEQSGSVLVVARGCKSRRQGKVVWFALEWCILLYLLCNRNMA